jgi:predicted O-methyltransferase YrrM
MLGQSGSMGSSLDEATWEGATLRLNDVEFETGMHAYSEWDHDRGRFLLLRPRGLIERYSDFWRGRRTPRRVIELGIWEGGSAAFWFEAFRPEKLVAVDAIVRADSPHFEQYIRERGLGDRLKTYWGVRQEDKQSLVSIAQREFDEPIDVVIDDASHRYGPTKSSLEALFPLLSPGGLYIIEDWQWAYTGFVPPPSWPDREPPSRLVEELLQAVGAGSASVRSLTIMHNFVAVEKAPTSS